MTKINVLDKSVYNLISAGEVVERPSSIVKELIENSIDAGSTEITVSIIDGGKNQIVITDNGCGINEEDLKLCYLPHATSKIHEAIDLETISTLGFRGEALASITAVAQVKIASRTESQELGSYIQINGGKEVENGQIGMSVGTTITVENIFFNTPVRRKFLKKGKQEEHYIKQIITELIFANPDVKFTFICDNKVIFKTNGGLENALYSVYPLDVANQMIPFDVSIGNFRVYGYTGDKNVFKHNKNFQTIIINGRTIQDTLIQTAVSQAYGEHLMKRCFPVFILNIIMPFDQLDVNVHPSKNEVRFEDGRLVFSAVYHAINQTLAQINEKLIIKPDNNIEDTQFNKVPVIDLYKQEENDKVDNYKNSDLEFNNNSENDKLYRFPVDDSLINDEEKNKLDMNIQKQRTILTDFNTTKAEEVISTKYKPLEQFDNAEQSSLFEAVENSCVQDYRIIGQLFKTFLILESGETCYIIDQHACHERFLYDKLTAKIENSKPLSQPMLVPFIVDCNANQYDYFKAIIKPLEELGFEIEEFGGLTYRVTAVPAILTNINLQTFFNNILYEKTANYNITKTELIKDKLATQACKAAIKGGDVLTNVQIRAILDKMKDGIPLQCPHGRPAVLEITRTQLDKMFKRIV